MTPAPPLRLNIDLGALAANWRWFAGASGVDTGAAVKANAYGLGVRAVVDRLYREGCRTFYVATWAAAAELGDRPADMRVKVLHGVLPGEMQAALAVGADPVLSSIEQIALWRSGAPGRACDVMVDTGMNRLGLDWRTFSTDMLAGLSVQRIHSHLACADDASHALNAEQLRRFRGIAAAVPEIAASLANSGGVCLGRDYAFSHVRPGLGLYGGTPNPAAAGHIRQVVHPEARVIQLRDVAAGDSAGYGATWTAAQDTRLAVVNVGYADGYLRGFSNRGEIIVGGIRCRVVGRVSMDLVIADVSAADAHPGDWVEIAYDLETASGQSGLSQYELLTGLGARYERCYR